MKFTLTAKREVDAPIIRIGCRDICPTVIKDNTGDVPDRLVYRWDDQEITITPEFDGTRGGSYSAFDSDNQEYHAYTIKDILYDWYKDFAQSWPVKLVYALPLEENTLPFFPERIIHVPVSDDEGRSKKRKHKWFGRA